MRPNQMSQLSMSENDKEAFQKFNEKVYKQMQDDIDRGEAPQMDIFTDEEEPKREERPEQNNLEQPPRSTSLVQPRERDQILSQDSSIVIISNGIQAPTFTFKQPAKRTFTFPTAPPKHETMN